MMAQIRKFILMLFALALSVASAKAQFNMLDTALYEARVKLVDEFFERFNGEETRADTRNSQHPELDNLLLLFNLEQFAYDQEKADQAKCFVNKVLADTVRINYSDSTWFAIAHCYGKLGGKAVDFPLYLNVEQRGDDMYKWVITKADGPLFSLDNKLSRNDLMLYPNAHETEFLALSQMSKETSKYALCYTRRTFTPDPTSVFLTLMQNGLLKIEYVQSVEYLFLQVPGYAFIIKEFERESKNAGWLIDQLMEMSDLEKQKLLESMYYTK